MRHVIALSGGKDSTAMAIGLREREPRHYEFICTPTGNELPEMRAHWQKLETLLETKITWVTDPFTDNLQNLILKRNAIPNARMRFCTRELRIQPAIAYLSAIAPVTQYVGLRYDEEHRAGIFGTLPAIIQDYPLRRWGWGICEVLACLQKHNIQIPTRTDCAWCFNQRLQEWKNLSEQHPDLYAQAAAIEKTTGHTFRSPTRDTRPPDLETLLKDFREGKPLIERNYKKDRCPLCDL